MSRGIKQPTADVSKVRVRPLHGLGALSGREMGADSRTQSPGELCQTRLQDTDTSSQTKQPCSYSLIHIHAHLRAEEEGRYTHTITCRHMDTQIYVKALSKASIYIHSESCTVVCRQAHTHIYYNLETQP